VSLRQQERNESPINGCCLIGGGILRAGEEDLPPVVAAGPSAGQVRK